MMKVGVAKEMAASERRVALVPDAIRKLHEAGLTVVVEKGAGVAAAFPDSAYVEAGARIVTTAALYSGSDVILRVNKPSADEFKQLHQGQVVIGMLSPLLDPQGMQAMARRGITAISLDAIPRTLTRSQDMDALTSQANVAGYKAVLIAASTFGRFFPLLTTAAGTAKPANVLVLGVGVAGLQAIATARRLGAVVRAYDVRKDTKEQAESLGAQFVVLQSAVDASGEGGYARPLTPEEQAAQLAEMNDVIAAQDVVITTAQVPGRRPPVLVTKGAVERMRSGSIVVDLAAGDLGGNCELSRPGKVVTSANGVEIHAPANLPASMPAGSSIFYSRNITNLLLNFVEEGQLKLDFEDEVTAATVITHAGRVVQQATLSLLQNAPKGGLRA
jgi:NAD(P) transhydrogenase subunit alpha